MKHKVFFICLLVIYLVLLSSAAVNRAARGSICVLHCRKTQLSLVTEKTLHLHHKLEFVHWEAEGKLHLEGV